MIDVAKLNENTVVTDESGQARVLLAGDTVPSWATDQVGKHLIDGDVAVEAVPYTSRKMADLKAEIAKRNEGRDDADKIDPVGRASVESYAAALAADDAAGNAPQVTSTGDGAGTGTAQAAGDGYGATVGGAATTAANGGPAQ